MNICDAVNQRRTNRAFFGVALMRRNPLFNERGVNFSA
jgi:hypothetical protein